MEKIRFDDFIKLNRGFDLPDSQIEEGEYPVVASTNIKAYHKAYKVEGPMVVTGRSGSLGSVQYIEGRCWPLNTTLYVKDFKGNSPRYVYYFLKTMHLEQYNAGAGVPTLNQNHLHSLKINIHKKDAQHRIASILSAYDNLIENNNKRIRLLEQMAENLYKEWFVRFRFPGHEKYSFFNRIPSNSSICQLKDLVIRRNKVLKEWNNLPLIDLSRMNSYELHISDTGNGEELTSNVKEVCKYDILFGSIRSYQGKCGYSPIDGAIAGSVYNFYPQQKNMFSFLLLLTISKPFIDYTVNFSNGTKMPVLNFKDLVRFKIPILNDKSIYQKFNDFVFPMIKEIDKLNHQNWSLKKERDLLLPRLMSGKLEVKV